MQTTARTLPGLWRAAVAEQRESPAYLVPVAEGWTEVSWAEAATRVDALAHGLLDLGVRRGDRFAILGQTTLDWVLLDWALLSIGAVVVPIYPTSSESECAYILENSEASGIAVEDQSAREALEPLRDRLPALDHVVGFAGLDAIAERGRAHAASSADALQAAAAAVGADDIATCIYTSGTTGPPKGCLLRHSNYAAVALRLRERRDFLQRGDKTVLFLPLAHTFGRLVHLAAAPIGITLAFCPAVEDLPRAVQQVGPEFLPAVPRVYEKVQASIEAKLGEATGVRRALAEWAVAVGRRRSALAQSGRPCPAPLRFQHLIADRLVLSKVRAGLGGRLRIGVSGAAPLGRETLEFFHAIGIQLLEAYGLTECLPVAVNMPGESKLGTVGKPFPGCEVAIADDGEILARGEPLFAGYFRDEEATRAAIDEDGWFHTGDVGHLDDDGFLTITDRKKDFIATAGGKKIAPQNVEQLLKQRSSLVSHALIVGDRRPYIAALITLSEEELARWARERGLDAEYEALAVSADVRAVVERAVEEANRQLARPQQVKRFSILPRDFSADEDEITPTLKVKRAVCMEHFQTEIDALYDGGRA